MRRQKLGDKTRLLAKKFGHREFFLRKPRDLKLHPQRDDDPHKLRRLRRATGPRRAAMRAVPR